MKIKITTMLIAMMFIFATAFAQESKHMEFMGIPITGNVNDFAKKMEVKGFEKMPNSDGLITLSGKFTNRDVLVGLVVTQGTNDIYRVGVMFDPNDSWDNLESHQNYLVEVFTKKYGEREEPIREIGSLYKDSGNRMFLGFNNSKVKYSDSWILQNGWIQISISSASGYEAYIVIIYEDSVGAQLLEEEILNEI